MKKITSILLSVAMLLTMAVMFTGCGGKTENAANYSVKDNPEFTQHFLLGGPSGYGTLGGVDSSYYGKLADKFSDDKTSQKYETLKDFYKDCQMNIISGGKNGKLKNGDVLKLKFKEPLDPEVVKENAYEKDLYTSNEFVYVVNGLPEAKIVDDITENDFTLSFTGISGETGVTISTKDNYPYPIRTTINKDNLKKGDKYSIKIYIYNFEDNYKAYTFKNGYVQFDYTAENIPYAPDTLDGIDTTEVDQQLANLDKDSCHKLGYDDIGSTKYYSRFTDADPVKYELEDNYFTRGNIGYYVYCDYREVDNYDNGKDYAYELKICPVVVDNGKLAFVFDSGYSGDDNNDKNITTTLDSYDSTSIDWCGYNDKSGIIQNLNNYKKSLNIQN